MLKVNVGVANAHALLQTENVTLMFVGIVGSGELSNAMTAFCVV